MPVGEKLANALRAGQGCGWWGLQVKYFFVAPICKIYAQYLSRVKHFALSFDHCADVLCGLSKEKLSGGHRIHPINQKRVKLFIDEINEIAGCDQILQLWSQECGKF